MTTAIIVDSSVWIDHFNNAIPVMLHLLEQRRLLVHPLVQGEILVGSMRNRSRVRSFLNSIEQAPVVDHGIVLEHLETWQAFNSGIGWIDMHLLSSAYASETLLWTRDKRLGALADRLGLRFAES